MDRKTFKSKPYHTRTKHNGEIEKIVVPSDTDHGTPDIPTNVCVYGTAHVHGTARFDDSALAANALIFGHRLSVSGSSSVPMENVPSASVLYLTPHTSEFVGLYLGDHWGVKQTSMVTKSLQAVTASNTNHDVFVYWDRDRKVVDLEFIAWSSDRVRADELGKQDGVYVKQSDPSRRYAGTIRTVAPGVVADASTRRFVWNYFNRVERFCQQPIETTDSWTYSGTSFRIANGQTANSFELVIGDPETVIATVHTLGKGVTGYGCTVGIGINSTTVNSANIYGAITIADDVSGQLYEPCRADYTNIPPVGYNRFHWLEITGGTSVTFYGDGGNSTYFRFGIMGRVRG